MGSGIGGGCCQVSNLLYWLALNAGMRIVERHRHRFDLFPDQNRRVPFGAGATVFYNFADLRFENRCPSRCCSSLAVEQGELRGELRTLSDPGFRVEVLEAEHAFSRQGDRWLRENRVRRRILGLDGAVLVDEEVLPQPRGSSSNDPRLAPGGS